MRSTVAGLLVLSLLAGSAFAQSDNRAKLAQKNFNTVELLESQVADIEFVDQPLDTVIDWLGKEFAGRNIYVNWQQLESLSIEKTKEVTLSLKGFTLSRVLWMIMKEASGGETRLAYRASGNLIVISTADDLGQEMIVKVYDVTDLIVRVRNFTNAPQIDIQQAAQSGGGGGGGNIFGGGGGGQEDEEDEEQQAGEVDPEMELLIEMITNTIDFESWFANGGKGTITAFRRQLVVRNNIGVHQKLGGASEEGAVR